MNTGATVGIVIPSYNQGRFIEYTILSVIRNKNHAHIKLVVIDGGSSDETVSVLNKYKDHIDFWVSEKDDGQSDAINKGMQLLTGCEYVTWINSDDVYETDDAVAKMLAFSQRRGCDVCYAKSYYIDENGEKTGSYATYTFSCESLKYECYISQPSTLIRREAWDRVGGVDKHLYMCMDYELWIKLGKKHSFEYYEEYIANTRIYKDTKTAKNQLIHINEAIAIISKYYGWVPYKWILAKILRGNPPDGNVYKAWCKLKAVLFKRYYVLNAICGVRASGYR